MKIKRYFARDMRSALRAVQQEQGPDAVILSSHESEQGIELVAAVDYDESLIHQARRPSGRQAEQAAQAPPQAGAPAGLSSLEHQFEAMREMLETRLDAVSASYHTDSTGRRSAHALLSGIGIRAGHAARLAEGVDAALPAAAARKRVMSLLAAQLPLASRDVLVNGGALALVGPTGVGKTTTAAKLAARHILHCGQGSVQFVGTDEYRIGAQEQLAAFGRILGAPLHRVHGADELSEILQARRKDELILVDTAGIGGRDLVLHQQFDLLRPQARLHRALCLSAATSGPDLAMQSRRFSAAKPNCLILTKLDETQQLGQALSFLLDRKLPLVYTSDGQQVPEDLHLPRALDLLACAIEQRRRCSQPGAQEEARACA